MDAKLRFSRFVHFLEKSGVIAVFHILSRKVIFVKKEDIKSIKNALLSESPSGTVAEALDYLKENRFIIPTDEDEINELKLLRQAILQRPAIDTLYLLLTDNCNFACSYCFFEGSYKNSKKKSTNMPKELALASIRKFADYLKKVYEYPDFQPKETSVVFYGGEPLINSGLFFVAVEEIMRLKKANKFPQNLAINVNTNGSLINHKIASFCAKNNIEIDVSLDGYQSAHDACRIWRGNNHGTFQDVMKGIAILKEVGVKTCISCTVSEANVNELPKIFNWFLDGVGVNNVGFNPLLNSYQYKINDPDYPWKVANAMIECFKIARERGIYEARMMRKVRAFIEGTIYDRDCCGCGKQVVILPNGKVGVCHAYSGTTRFFVDPDEKFDPFKHPFWNEWSQRSPINMPQCSNCEALTICGGGCPHNADINKGSIWELDDHFCIHAKETLRWLIWDLYEKMK